ncbi:MAG: hypothetical protein ACI8TQ_003782 [Planctomycetota bacterium]|jgi:hypothetical protein
MILLPAPLAPLLAEPATLLVDGPDWTAVGLVMSILGSFLLANAILFRHPRTMVEGLFRGEKRELRPIREYIFHRVQVTLGFLYMLGGFCLQLLGQYSKPPVAAELPFPTMWVGLVLLSALALEVLGWWLSHALFRHYVRAFLMRNPVDFVSEVRLAREVGELLGLETANDETVQSYVARLRAKLGLLEPTPRHEFGVDDELDEGMVEDLSPDPLRSAGSIGSSGR